MACREASDASSFTFEERLIVSVWIHEKKNTQKSYSGIRGDFRDRSGKEAPMDANLKILEKKVFVHDATRSGRPSKYGDDFTEQLFESIGHRNRSESDPLKCRFRVLFIE